MIVGPVLLLVDTLQRDDSLTGLFQIYAMMGMFLALIGVTQLSEARAPRLAAVTTVIGSVGIAGGVAFGLSGLYVGAGAEDLNEGSGVAASLGLHLPGPILPLAVILHGCAAAPHPDRSSLVRHRPDRGRRALPDHPHRGPADDRPHRRRPVDRRAGAARPGGAPGTGQRPFRLKCW